MKLIHFFVILSASLVLFSCNDNEQSKIETDESTSFLSEGTFTPIKNARLGPPVNYLSEVDDIYCHQLFIENQEVGWIFTTYQAKSNTLLFKCKIYEGEPFSPESKYGGRDSSAVFEAIKNKSKWLLSKIPIPNYDNFSNLTTCDDRIAYWGTNKKNDYASIYDLKERNIIKEIIIGEFELYTDYEGHFPFPEWNKECTKVIFPKHDNQPDDITIEINK